MAHSHQHHYHHPPHQYQYDEHESAPSESSMAESEDFETNSESVHCPLCMETMDFTDLAFHPCPCGYQVCLYCYNAIIDKLNGACPACRRVYDTDRAMETSSQSLSSSTTAATTKAIVRPKRDVCKSQSKSHQRHASQQAQQVALSNMRIVQRNLVYVQNLPSTLAHEEVLRKNQYFGKFGKITKASVARIKHPAGESSGGGKGVYNGYVTYKNSAHAAAAIAAMNGVTINHHPLKVHYGTTKYCAFYIRQQQCMNAQCLYVHEPARAEDCVHKDDLLDNPVIDPSLVSRDRERSAVSQSAAQQSSIASTGSVSVNVSSTQLKTPPNSSPVSTASDASSSSSANTAPASVFAFPLPAQVQPQAMPALSLQQSETKPEAPWSAVAASLASSSSSTAAPPSSSPQAAAVHPALTPTRPALSTATAVPSQPLHERAKTDSAPPGLSRRKSSYSTTSTPASHSNASTPTSQHTQRTLSMDGTPPQSPHITQSSPIAMPVSLLKPSNPPPGFERRAPLAAPPLIHSSTLDAVFAPSSNKSLTQSLAMHSGEETVLPMYFPSNPRVASQPPVGVARSQPPPGFGFHAPSPQSQLHSFSHSHSSPSSAASNPPPGFVGPIARPMQSTAWDFDSFVAQLTKRESSLPSMPTGNEPLQPIPSHSHYHPHPAYQSHSFAPPPRYNFPQSSATSAQLDDEDWSARADRDDFFLHDSGSSRRRSTDAFDDSVSPFQHWHSRGSGSNGHYQHSDNQDSVYRSITSPSNQQAFRSLLQTDLVGVKAAQQQSTTTRGILRLKALPTSPTGASALTSPSSHAVATVSHTRS